MKSNPSMRRWAAALMGVAALVWFLIRVIPKPSRALYPCQRAAFPVATGFVIWILGLGVNAMALTPLARVRQGQGRARGVQSPAIIGTLFLAAYLATCGSHQPPQGDAVAALERSVDGVADHSQGPLGEPKGVVPGRVVWAHDPAATDWGGLDDGYWWQGEHTRQRVVDRMLERSMIALTTSETERVSELRDAWTAIFRHYNVAHGRGDADYAPGEKIVIKVNLVGFIAVWGGYADPSQYPNTSPQIMHAMLDQLVNVVGVRERDITLGDPLSDFADSYYDLLVGDFPDVNYMSFNPLPGRTPTVLSDTPMYWSAPEAGGRQQDYIPQSYVDASYLINIANLKGHFNVAGVTLCGKNHFGSLLRKPGSDPEFFDLHASCPLINGQQSSYRALVDLMGHAELGGKTLLFVVDGLYGARHQAVVDGNVPVRWQSAPFNGDWTSSLFVSMDPVAIDSVGFDFLVAEWGVPEPAELGGPWSVGADDYLHEAALAGAPPSGTFYDPNHASPTVRLDNLGVHEHWDNPVSKSYSGNYGGAGIELVKLSHCRCRRAHGGRRCPMSEDRGMPR